MTLRKRDASPSLPNLPRFASAMQRPLTEPFLPSIESRMRAELRVPSAVSCHGAELAYRW